MNPFNKDAKYEARLRTWQESIEKQSLSYKRIEDRVQMLKNHHANLLEEKHILADKLGPRAQSINSELEEIEKDIQNEQRGLSLRKSVREATFDEMARLAEKQIKSAKKATKKWEEAKREGRHVEPYVPSERAKRIRILVPIIGILSNFLDV